MTFNTEPSANNLETYLNKVEPYEIYMMVFAHGTESVGLALVDLIKESTEGQFAGVDGKKISQRFCRLCALPFVSPKNPGPIPTAGAFPAEKFFIFLKQEGSSYDIEWLEQNSGRNNNTLISEARVFYSRA